MSEGFSLCRLTAGVELRVPRVELRAAGPVIWLHRAFKKSFWSSVLRTPVLWNGRGPIELRDQRRRTVHFANGNIVQKSPPNTNAGTSGADRPRRNRLRTRFAGPAASDSCRAAVRLNFVWVGAWTAHP